VEFCDVSNIMNNHMSITRKDGNPEKVEDDIITDKVVGSIITGRGETQYQQGDTRMPNQEASQRERQSVINEMRRLNNSGNPNMRGGGRAPGRHSQRSSSQ
jgi:hypothetical protein